MHYRYLDRHFHQVTMFDTRPHGRTYMVLVDARTHEPTDDLASMEVANDQAYTAKYGKLQPHLVARLAKLQDNDFVTVTIWVAAERGQRLPEREAAARAILAARHAGNQVEQGGDLARRYDAEYRSLLDADVAQRIQPLIAALHAQGHTVRTVAGLPAVTVTLPKRALTALAQRHDVGTIYRSEPSVRFAAAYNGGCTCACGTADAAAVST